MTFVIKTEEPDIPVQYSGMKYNSIHAAGYKIRLLRAGLLIAGMGRPPGQGTAGLFPYAGVDNTGTGLAFLARMGFESGGYAAGRRPFSLGHLRDKTHA